MHAARPSFGQEVSSIRAWRRVERAKARRAIRRALCAVVATLQLTIGAGAQEATEVAPFRIVAALLNVLLAEQACKNIAVNHDAFAHYLAEHGIDAAQLSRTGPNAGQLVETRRKLRRAFARHNKEACERTAGMFGPDGTAIPGLAELR
jgi:hypothetical protein